MSVPNIVQLGEGCCGCGACAAKCPRECISMKPDPYGFLRPGIDMDACVNCGGCDSVCPAFNKGLAVDPTYAMWAKSASEEEVLRSSSGGIFALLAHDTLCEGGVVVGAAWEEGCGDLCHTVVEDESELDSIMRSKYVQSFIGRGVYKSVLAALRANRKVLFVGTACQVSAIRNYLGAAAEADDLLCVDVICHGVPAPKLWQDWLADHEKAQGAKVCKVNFRSKAAGWLSFCVQYEYCTQKDAPPIVESCVFSDDWYMRTFLKNASLRGSCFQCPSKSSCGSDVTLGDFWGIQAAHPEVDYSRGVSAVLVNSAKGAKAIESIKPHLEFGASSINKILSGNPCLKHSVQPYFDYDSFMQAVAEGMPISEMRKRWDFEPTAVQKLRNQLGRFKRKLRRIAKGLIAVD